MRERERRTEQLEKLVEREMGVNVAIEERNGILTVSGRVASTEEHDNALELIGRAAPDLKVNDDLEIEQVVPEPVADLYREEPTPGLTIDELPGLREDDAEVAPDFTNQPLVTDVIPVIEDGDEAYFPPTDPVITTQTDRDEQESISMLGGFTPTSMASDDVEPSVSDARLGDEAIATAVIRELREDASTTDLRVEVTVRDGLVVLRGRVPLLDDAENAEAVAARVPGVAEVREELEVEQL